MKKIMTSLITLSLFMAFLLVPIFLMFQNAHMNHGDSQKSNNCISHCLISSDAIEHGSIYSGFVFQIFIISFKVFHSIFNQNLFVGVFLVCIFAPPNLLRAIKNYQYYLLTGVVKSLN